MPVLCLSVCLVVIGLVDILGEETLCLILGCNYEWFMSLIKLVCKTKKKEERNKNPSQFLLND